MDMENQDYRIAFFSNTFLPFVGGVALSASLYQKHLKRRGDRVVVYAPEYEDADEDEDDVRRMPAIQNFNQSGFSLPIPFTTRHLSDFKRERFDIVHVHHPFLLGEMGMAQAREWRLPLVFTYHTQYEQYTHYVPLEQETAGTTIVRHATEFCDLCDLVIAPTGDIERMLRRRGVKSPIEILPTGVELERFEQADGGATRKELGIAEGAPVLVHVGRLAREKNLPFLMRACLKVLAEADEAHFIVAGEGKNKEELEKMAKEAGEVSRRVHFLGRREGRALADTYAAGDLFVFASKSETQGMVIAEAMAAGTPVVALEADGVRDILEDDVNGRRLDGDASEDGFARATLEAIASEDARARWREGARESARRMDMPVLADRLHEFYRSLKLMPNHRLHRESMTFGLLRNYFETLWDEMGDKLKDYL